MKNTNGTALSNTPIVSQEYNLLVDGVIELAPNTDAKAFFDDLLDVVLEYAERHEASAVLSMSHHLLETVEDEEEEEEEEDGEQETAPER